jgi:hypothetical protein
VGHFQDEMMHGEGMLTWSDEFGVCRYKGSFENNLFQGEGCLEWSIKARYVGQFFNGFYHGEGTFEWPDKSHEYHGQWQYGEMSGKGTLHTSCGTMYSGDFFAGNMEGKGTITFITKDQYVGAFKNSMFDGLGCYTWSTGTSLSGLFEKNYCNRVGKKTYPGGQVYVGELKLDLEHGKGVYLDGKQRLLGLWENGKITEELFESVVPALEIDAVNGDEQKVFGGYRAANVGAPSLPVNDENGKPVEGQAIVLYLNGDKYIGQMVGGKKHGQGMYIYADLTAYKGVWDEDRLNGVMHPMGEEQLPVEVKQLHDFNYENHELNEQLKVATATGEKKVPQPPPPR